MRFSSFLEGGRTADGDFFCCLVEEGIGWDLYDFLFIILSAKKPKSLVCRIRTGSSAFELVRWDSNSAVASGPTLILTIVRLFTSKHNVTGGNFELMDF